MKKSTLEALISETIKEQFLSENAGVSVIIDRKNTLALRDSFPLFSDITVATFEQPVGLYRIFDEKELYHILSSGKITGGTYAAKPERTFGASWGTNISELIAWGNKQKGNRLGNQLYIAKIDGFDRKFLHLDPKLKFDPNGPEQQPAKMNSSVCNSGLGCSIMNVSLNDVETFYKVDGDRIHRISEEELKAEQPLDEFNAVGAGGVVGYTLPLGMSAKGGHKKLWSNPKVKNPVSAALKRRVSESVGWDTDEQHYKDMLAWYKQVNPDEVLPKVKEPYSVPFGVVLALSDPEITWQRAKEIISKELGRMTYEYGIFLGGKGYKGSSLIEILMANLKKLRITLPPLEPVKENAPAKQTDGIYQYVSSIKDKPDQEWHSSVESAFKKYGKSKGVLLMKNKSGKISWYDDGLDDYRPLKESDDAFGAKINTRAPMFPKEVDRITNLALYGETDEEILAALGDAVDGKFITPRWVKFIAAQARREAGLTESSLFKGPRDAHAYSDKLNAPKEYPNGDPNVLQSISGHDDSPLRKPDHIEGFIDNGDVKRRGFTVNDRMHEDLEEIINEPKRTGLTQGMLKLKQNGGMQNIIKVYSQATPEERDYWGRWYHNAKSDVEELAQKYKLSFPIMAGIVAVLSPGNKWAGNLLAADRLLISYFHPEQVQKINAYPNAIAKAMKILQTGDLKFVTGPKVTVFWKSLMNPTDVEKHMVLDGHAINIWRGAKVRLKGLKSPTVAERAKMISDYEKAAEKLGTSVQAVQAITWYIWKYTQPDVPKTGPSTNIDTSAFKAAAKATRKAKQIQTEAYFHGTSAELEPGQIILPPIVTGRISEKGRKKNLDKVFFTKDAKSAKIYAGRAKHSLGGNPVVYEIEPLGDIQVISSTEGTSVYMAPSAKVIRKLEESATLDSDRSSNNE